MNLPPEEVRPYRLVRHRFHIEPASFITRKCDVINWNVAHYQKLIDDFMASAGSIVATSCQWPVQPIPDYPQLTHLHLSIEDASDCDRPQAPNYLNYSAKLSEEYSLNIHNTSGRALIQATNIWGVVRALETFYQLLYHHPEQHCNHHQSSLVLVNITRIFDCPRFIYRGLMLDTARNYIPLELLRLNLVSVLLYLC